MFPFSLLVLLPLGQASSLFRGKGYGLYSEAFENSYLKIASYDALAPVVSYDLDGQSIFHNGLYWRDSVFNFIPQDCFELTIFGETIHPHYELTVSATFSFLKALHLFIPDNEIYGLKLQEAANRYSVTIYGPEDLLNTIFMKAMDEVSKGDEGIFQIPVNFVGVVRSDIKMCAKDPERISFSILHENQHIQLDDACSRSLKIMLNSLALIYGFPFGGIKLVKNGRKIEESDKVLTAIAAVEHQHLFLIAPFASGMSSLQFYCLPMDFNLNKIKAMELSGFSDSQTVEAKFFLDADVGEQDCQIIMQAIRRLPIVNYWKSLTIKGSTIDNSVSIFLRTSVTGTKIPLLDDEDTNIVEAFQRGRLPRDIRPAQFIIENPMATVKNTKKAFAFYSVLENTDVIKALLLHSSGSILFRRKTEFNQFIHKVVIRNKSNSPNLLEYIWVMSLPDVKECNESWSICSYRFFKFLQMNIAGVDISASVVTIHPNILSIKRGSPVDSYHLKAETETRFYVDLKLHVPNPTISSPSMSIGKETEMIYDHAAVRDLVLECTMPAENPIATQLDGAVCENLSSPESLQKTEIGNVPSCVILEELRLAGLVPSETQAVESKHISRNLRFEIAENSAPTGFLMLIQLQESARLIDEEVFCSFVGTFKGCDLVYSISYFSNGLLEFSVVDGLSFGQLVSLGCAIKGLVHEMLEVSASDYTFRMITLAK